ncbi:hypothetical protein J31TS4_03940 [Paenibacillus sp. J31TS4]|nr:hypothetical protein J31TS4_03940 [Paenibacillus sp. J31TS4]
MQITWLYVLLAGLGFGLYTLMILGNQPVYEKILFCELGSALLIISCVFALRSTNKPED